MMFPMLSYTVPDWLRTCDAMSRSEHVVSVDERSSAGVVDPALDEVSAPDHEGQLDWSGCAYPPL